jgi:hypothetical protein
MTLSKESIRLLNEIDDGDFKNFHRLICERFDYGHDPVDWKRDQLSLIEHIAACIRELESAQCRLHIATTMQAPCRACGRSWEAHTSDREGNRFHLGDMNRRKLRDLGR